MGYNEFMPTAHERARQQNERQAKLNARKDKFLADLKAELESRGHEVTDGVERVDGCSTYISVKEQGRDRNWSMTGNGRLYVSFRIDYRQGGETYTAPEGSKNGFNVKKAADRMEEMLEVEKHRQAAARKTEDRREKTRAAVKRIREAAGCEEFAQPGVRMSKYGQLQLDIGKVTEEEAVAVLNLLTEMRK